MTPPSDGRASGLAVALVSAAMFGTSGVFGKSLLAAGWSPAAAVLVRLGAASLLLSVPAWLALRGRWRPLLERWRPILLYGVFAGAAVQVAYFNAITYIEVGVALLMEYLGAVLVVLYEWVRTRRRPGWVTLGGMVVAVAGLAVVLNPGDLAGADPRGVAWALFAATGMAVYFITSANTTGVPPVAFVASGLGVGAVALLVFGLIGLVPLRASFADAAVLDSVVPWWMPVLELVVVAAALAYLLGFVAARRLGSTVASFVGLTEVVFAVVWAWLLLGELPSAVQLVGGVVLLAGVALVQVGHGPSEETPAASPAGSVAADGCGTRPDTMGPMRYMNIGGPIALGVLGAIMAFAMQDMIPGFDTRTVGFILLGAALLWLVFGFIAARPRTRITSERTNVVDDGRGVRGGGQSYEREVRQDEV